MYVYRALHVLGIVCVWLLITFVCTQTHSFPTYSITMLTTYGIAGCKSIATTQEKYHSGVVPYSYYSVLNMQQASLFCVDMATVL